LKFSTGTGIAANCFLFTVILACQGLFLDTDPKESETLLDPDLDPEREVTDPELDWTFTKK
jgi:hypothetical protein